MSIIMRILRIIIVAFTAFIVLKISTFGWRFWARSFTAGKEENVQLAERLKQHVYKLAQDIGDRSVFNYQGLQEAAGYISRQFESFGYQVELQEYTVYNKTVKNIIVSKKGSVSPQEIIIAGAHYDTCSNPGADDNASAVAAVLELARFISDKQTRRTIRFIAFVNEEPPFFKSEEMGSRVYARQAKRKGEEIKAALILESIGYYSQRLNSQRYPLFFGPFYPNRGNFIAVVGDFSSRRLVREVVANFKKKTRFPVESTVAFGFVPGIDFSDHWSFWQEGYRAAMITDTAFYRNPGYHSSRDTPDKLNYRYSSEVVEGLGAVIIELAG